MKKLVALLISATIVLALGNVFVLAEPETESVISSVESVTETESVVSEEGEAVSSDVASATVSENTVSYIEPEEFQKEVNINQQTAKESEDVAKYIGVVAWTIAGVCLTALFILAVVAYIKHRTRRR